MSGLNAPLRGCVAAMMMLAGSAASQAQELAVNGYTYFAPSYYPAPPVVVYDPAFIVPARTVIHPRQVYMAPVPVVYAEPAFVSQTVVPYNPVWNYGPAVAPMAYRERGHVNRHGLEYKYQAFVPGRHAPVYTYKVDAERHGVKIRERYR